MSEPLKLLLVEDSDVDAHLLVYELRQAHFDVKMQRVETEEEMRLALAEGEWDAIISDFHLPSFSAPAALTLLRESGLDLPFIIVSGTIGEETAVQIMRSGAHDYLMKGNLNRLAEALRREIREARVREERRQAEVALRESEGRFRMLFERSSDAIFVVDKKSGRYLDANRAAEKLTGRKIAEIKQLSIFDITPKGAQERLEQIAQSNETIEFGEVEHLRPDGSVRITQLTFVPINQAVIFGIARDITEVRQAQAALERRAREMELLYKTSLEINAQIDLNTLLNTIVKQAASLLNTPSGSLYLVEPDGETLKSVVSYNSPVNYLGITLRRGEGLVGRVVVSGEPMTVPDYMAWEGNSPLFDQAGFRRILGAPLMVKGKIIGVIAVADTEKAGVYSPEEIRLLQLIADQAAIAVENTRLFETAQRELAERRQAELALRQSEERYRTVVTGAEVVSFMLDNQGIFTFSEGKGLAQLGLKPGEVVGLSALEMYQDSPNIINAIQRALAGETVRSEDHIGPIVFDSTYAPFFAENGKVQGVIGVAVDITDRIQSEEQLRESERSYRGLFNSVADAIYIQDKDGRFLDVNQGAVDMYGYPREFFIGKSPELLGEPGKNDFNHIKQLLFKAFQGETQTFEFWGRRRNGEVFPKDVRLFKGDYFGQQVVIALAHDITERKRAEQALRRQLKELTLLHVIAGMAIRARTIDELVEFVTQEVGRAFYSDNFGFCFLDETEQFLRPHLSYQGLAANVPRLYPIHGSVSGSVILSGKPRRIGDVTKIPDYLMVNPDIRSELCVPLKLGERVIGIINAESMQLDFFTDEDERLLLTIAGQMANAIERFRLFEAENKRRREAETMREAISALSTSLELEKVLEIIMNSIERVVPFDSASIFLLEGQSLRIMMARGLPNLEKAINQTFPADDGLFTETLRNGHLLILEDAQADPRFNRWGDTTYVRGWMAVPLLARGEVIGYITLDSRAPAAYSQEHATLAQAFANQAAIAIQNARLFERIQNSLRELNEAYETTIEGWSRALDLRDRETEGHTLRVTDLTLKMAEAMGFSEEERVHIRRGALLHDMGKLGVPDRILLKPDSLTDDEWEVMRMHPLYTYQMLSPIEYLRPALDIPFSHHERWDGSGYPRGLKGEEIPLVARIFAVIDVWDALTSDRPYRPAWSQQATLEYLKKNAGIQFDPEVVKIFLKLWDEGKIS